MSCDKATGKALRDEINRIDSMVVKLKRDRQRIVGDYMQWALPKDSDTASMLETSELSGGMHIKDFVEFAEHVDSVGAALAVKIDS